LASGVHASPFVRLHAPAWIGVLLVIAWPAA
jgi:hypothetical protein